MTCTVSTDMLFIFCKIIYIYSKILTEIIEGNRYSLYTNTIVLTIPNVLHVGHVIFLFYFKVRFT